MQATRSSHHTLQFDSELVTYVLSYLLFYMLNTNLKHEESCRLTVLHSERPSKVQAGTPTNDNSNNFNIEIGRL